MEIKSYQNIYNPHKRIYVKRTNDRHYMWRQQMEFPNGVKNPVGTPKGGFRRQSITTIKEVLRDYVCVGY